jgi:hypothetical protein
MTTLLQHQESCDELLYTLLPSSEKRKNYMSHNPKMVLQTKPGIFQDLLRRKSETWKNAGSATEGVKKTQSKM